LEAVARLHASPVHREVDPRAHALDLQVVISHPGLDSAEAERILLRYASMATGVDLEAVPLDE
jgi:hypothetical protein